VKNLNCVYKLYLGARIYNCTVPYNIIIIRKGGKKCLPRLPPRTFWVVKNSHLFNIHSEYAPIPPGITIMRCTHTHTLIYIYAWTLHIIILWYIYMCISNTFVCIGARINYIGLYIHTQAYMACVCVCIRIIEIYIYIYICIMHPRLNKGRQEILEN